MNIRTLLAAAIATAFVAASANAQTFTIDWKVNGVEGVTVAPGATVVVTGTANWNPATFGLGSAAFRVNMNNADLGDTLLYTEAMGLGRNPLLRLASQTLTDSMSGSVRSITGAGATPVDTAQLPSFMNPLFTSANPVELFRYTVTLGPGARTIAIGSTMTGLNLYANAQGQPVTVQYQRASDGATITVVPTPGSLALLAVGGAFSIRRKRKN